ncbi:YciI family protein [Aquimarina sp. 2201CG5-10]|uniref:YciI family protein n=1 Tax=Aquimarina callyspongiae TaxID=3098150 RepID=UPI002AB35993|nr:YciI family protein [Aquimarina sp. 2201CG5-10]MDY8137791.1 YciI family protein [Aquimarina sp. 2201CG5-10]
MKQFMFLFKGGDEVWDTKSPEQQQEHMQHWQKWIGEIAQQEKFVGGERLYPHGNTIHPGGTKITDRPLAESKELVGGYIVVKAETIEEATEIAKGCPGLQWESSLEVREVWPEH